MGKAINKKITCIAAMLLMVAMIFGMAYVNEPRGSEQVYSVNKYGETYGEQIYGSSEEPDLVAVVATNGKEGYIKNSDVNKYGGGNVNSPEEAIEYMKSRNQEESIKIPVYTKDGDVVIGFFELGGTSQGSQTNADTGSRNLNAVFVASADGSDKIVSGYKYRYRFNSSVVAFTKPLAGYCAAYAYVYNTEMSNVPVGYFGALPRLYNSLGKLVISGKWAYNASPVYGKGFKTNDVKGDGKTYFALGKVRIYNGNGYNEYSCNMSPFLKVAAKDAAYEVNEKGETYGCALYGEIIGGEPDFIEAVGVGGVEGYVKSSDFEVDNSTPERAAESSPADGECAHRMIDLYDKEGNVIGQFELGLSVEEVEASNEL